MGVYSLIYNGNIIKKLKSSGLLKIKTDYKQIEYLLLKTGSYTLI